MAEEAQEDDHNNFDNQWLIPREQIEQQLNGKYDVLHSNERRTLLVYTSKDDGGDKVVRIAKEGHKRELVRLAKLFEAKPQLDNAIIDKEYRYIIVPYKNGKTLSLIMDPKFKDVTLTKDYEQLGVLLMIARKLQQLHDVHGVVWNGLCPSNIVIDAGKQYEVSFIDFKKAKVCNLIQNEEQTLRCVDTEEAVFNATQLGSTKMNIHSDWYSFLICFVYVLSARGNKLKLNESTSFKAKQVAIFKYLSNDQKNQPINTNFEQTLVVDQIEAVSSEPVFKLFQIINKHSDNDPTKISGKIISEIVEYFECVVKKENLADVAKKLFLKFCPLIGRYIKDISSLINHDSTDIWTLHALENNLFDWLDLISANLDAWAEFQQVQKESFLSTIIKHDSLKQEFQNFIDCEPQGSESEGDYLLAVLCEKYGTNWNKINQQLASVHGMTQLTADMTAQTYRALTPTEQFNFLKKHNFAVYSNDEDMPDNQVRQEPLTSAAWEEDIIQNQLLNDFTSDCPKEQISFIVCRMFKLISRAYSEETRKELADLANKYLAIKKWFDTWINYKMKMLIQLNDTEFFDDYTLCICQFIKYYCNDSESLRLHSQLYPDCPSVIPKWCGQGIDDENEQIVQIENSGLDKESNPLQSEAKEADIAMDESNEDIVQDGDKNEQIVQIDRDHLDNDSNPLQSDVKEADIAMDESNEDIVPDGDKNEQIVKTDSDQLDKESNPLQSEVKEADIVMDDSNENIVQDGDKNQQIVQIGSDHLDNDSNPLQSDVKEADMAMDESNEDDPLSPASDVIMDEDGQVDEETQAVVPTPLTITTITIESIENSVIRMLLSKPDVRQKLSEEQMKELYLDIYTIEQKLAEFKRHSQSVVSILEGKTGIMLQFMTFQSRWIPLVGNVADNISRFFITDLDKWLKTLLTKKFKAQKRISADENVEEFDDESDDESDDKYDDESDDRAKSNDNSNSNNTASKPRVSTYGDTRRVRFFGQSDDEARVFHPEQPRNFCLSEYKYGMTKLEEFLRDTDDQKQFDLRFFHRAPTVTLPNISLSEKEKQKKKKYGGHVCVVLFPYLTMQLQGDEKKLRQIFRILNKVYFPRIGVSMDSHDNWRSLSDLFILGFKFLEPRLTPPNIKPGEVAFLTELCDKMIAVHGQNESICKELEPDLVTVDITGLCDYDLRLRQILDRLALTREYKDLDEMTGYKLAYQEQQDELVKRVKKVGIVRVEVNYWNRGALHCFDKPIGLTGIHSSPHYPNGDGNTLTSNSIVHVIYLTDFVREGCGCPGFYVGSHLPKKAQITALKQRRAWKHKIGTWTRVQKFGHIGQEILTLGSTLFNVQANENLSTQFFMYVVEEYKYMQGINELTDVVENSPTVPWPADITYITTRKELKKWNKASNKLNLTAPLKDIDFSQIVDWKFKKGKGATDTDMKITNMDELDEFMIAPLDGLAKYGNDFEPNTKGWTREDLAMQQALLDHYKDFKVKKSKPKKPRKKKLSKRAMKREADDSSSSDN